MQWIFFDYCQAIEALTLLLAFQNMHILYKNAYSLHLALFIYVYKCMYVCIYIYTHMHTYIPGGGQPTPVFLPRESPWTEEPCGLQSTESQSDVTEAAYHSTHTHTHTHNVCVHLLT